MSFNINVTRIPAICFPLIATLLLVLSTTVDAQESQTAKISSTLGSERSDRIDTALKEDFSCDYFETRFGDVIVDLSSKLKIPIVLNDSVADLNLDEESLITIQLTNISVQSMLLIMLSPFECTAYNKDEVLYIASKESASSVYQTRIYDCRPLIAIAGIAIAGTGNQHGGQKLRNVIKNTIEPASWNRDSGAGGIAEFGGVLTIRQNPQTHYQIHHLLNALYEKFVEGNNQPDQTDQSDEAGETE